MSLFEQACEVRENAHAPYSGFKVGAALRVSSGKTFVGCNVENAAYPEGTCAEAGAIAAMVASGESEIANPHGDSVRKTAGELRPDSFKPSHLEA